MQVKTDNAGKVRLLNTMGALDGLSAKVGWFAQHQYPDGGPSIAQVAVWQEFGTATIPPRPFMRKTLVENQVKWLQLAGAFAKQVIDGQMTPELAFENLGRMAVGDIQTTIADGVGPPLSPVTLAIRAFILNEGRGTRGKLKGAHEIPIALAQVESGKLDVSIAPTNTLNWGGLMRNTVTAIVEKS